MTKCTGAAVVGAAVAGAAVAGTGALVAGAGALVAGAGAAVGVAAGAQLVKNNPNKIRAVISLAIFFISFFLLDQKGSD